MVSFECKVQKRKPENHMSGKDKFPISLVLIISGLLCAFSKTTWHRTVS